MTAGDRVITGAAMRVEQRIATMLTYLKLCHFDRSDGFIIAQWRNLLFVLAARKTGLQPLRSAFSAA